MIINNQYLKKYSPIPLNYNTDEIKNYIDVAELIYVRPLLGEDLYDELCEQVAEDNISDENATLLTEAIWPLLGFAVVHEALPSIAYHISEVSITKGKSDNSDPLTLKELSLFQTHIKNQVTVRQNFAYDWLKSHWESFPLWDGAVNCDCCKCGKNSTPKYFDKKLYSLLRRGCDIR